MSDKIGETRHTRVDREGLSAVIERIREDAALGIDGAYREGRVYWSIPITPEAVELLVDGYFVTKDGRKARVASLWIDWSSANVASVTPSFETFE